MTGPGPASERPAQQGGGDGHGRVNAARGVAVVVVAFALGVFLLNVGSRPPTSTAGTTTPTTSGTTTTTTTPGSSTTTAPKSSTTTVPRTTTTAHSGHHATTSTTATTVPHSSVAVLVANGTSTANQASEFSSALSGQGWNTLPPVDTTSPVAASAVYYASGQKAAALEVAQYIGVKPTSVLPLTTAVPVGSTTGADVVVVIGPDLVNKAPTAAS